VEQGREKPVVQLQHLAPVAAPDLVFRGVVGQIGAGIIQRRGDAPAASQALVELAEQHPRRRDQHRMGHRQDRGNARGGESSGHAGHRIALGVQGGRLTRGQNHQSDLGPVQVFRQVLGRDQMLAAIFPLEDQQTDADGFADCVVAADLAFPLDLAEDRLAEQAGVLFGVLFGHLRKDAMSVEVEDVDGRFSFGIVIQSLDKRIERGRPEELPGNATGRVFLQGVEHRLGIGPRIDKPGIGGTADDEQQVQAIFGLHNERCASFRGS